MKNKNYSRKCPQCGKDLFYSSNTSYNYGIRKNCLCRSCATKVYAKRIGDASFLLDESNESFYWIGFILADGSINKGVRLTITLSRKDKTHLEKLAKRLNIKTNDTEDVLNGNTYYQTTISIMHTDIFSKLTKKFMINQNKTINPPNSSVFEQLSNEELLSIFIGFIDGDGSIFKQYKRQDSRISIQIHSSWLNLLLYFNNRLNLNGKVSINKSGYALLQISDFVSCKLIKEKMLLLNIPFLKRKWDNIDLNFYGKSNQKIELL